MDLKQQLIREEGAESCAYQDSLGYWTIGVGRLIDSRKGGGLSNEEIDMLLENDIKRNYEAVLKALPWIEKLYDQRQAV
jgi:lysozyme